MWSLVVLLTVIGQQQPVPLCNRARSTVQMEECLKEELTKIDARLVTLERRVRDGVPRQSVMLFDAAAASWRAYRDQECKSVYEAIGDGSIAASSFLGCKIELAKSRLATLGKVYGSGR